jgi:hypothetical protein
MDLLQKLSAIDLRRAALDKYLPRLRSARWLLPVVARRLERRLNARIVALTEQREQVLRQIRADPHTNRRLRELYEGDQHTDFRPPSLRGFSPSDELKILGHRVVDWEAAEKEAERQFADALGYYSSGAWQKDEISSAAVDAFINGLRNERDDARLSRGAALDAFQRRLEREHGIGMGPVSLQRELLLAEFRKTALAPSRADAVDRFIERQKRPRIKAPSLMNDRER